MSEVVLTIPPLRERHGDAALLAHAFIGKFSRQEGRSLLSFKSDAIDAALSRRDQLHAQLVSAVMENVRRLYSTEQHRRPALPDWGISPKY